MPNGDARPSYPCRPWCECTCCEELHHTIDRRAREHVKELDEVEAMLADVRDMALAESNILRAQFEEMQRRYESLDRAYSRLYRDWCMRGSARVRLEYGLSDVMPLIVDTRPNPPEVTRVIQARAWLPVTPPETAARAGRVAELREIVKAGQADMYRQARGIRVREEETGV